MRHLPFIYLVLTISLSASDPIYTALREAGIKESFVVENLVIHKDAGVFTLKNGTIGLTAPQMGRDTVAVFSGDGEFTFTPALGIEAAYLKSITGKETVQERFDRALFCFTDKSGTELRTTAKDRGADAKR
jgi:hypothetical protein